MGFWNRMTGAAITVSSGWRRRPMASLAANSPEAACRGGVSSLDPAVPCTSLQRARAPGGPASSCSRRHAHGGRLLRFERTAAAGRLARRGFRGRHAPAALTTDQVSRSRHRVTVPCERHADVVSSLPANCSANRLTASHSV
jgi:hypothetical protein